MSMHFDRRTVLRGMVGGAAVGVGLPFLDCFLNGNGTALASGAPLPVRFGTWFWGLGVTPQRWTPVKEGRDYEITPELKMLEKYREHFNVMSGFNLMLDGRTVQPHGTGWAGNLTGSVPGPGVVTGPTVDVLISDAIGAASRFRSLEVAAGGTSQGVVSQSYSRRSEQAVNPAETSPAAVYARVFGSEFLDPNKADFKPDPKVMLRQSVLSAVKDDRKRLVAKVGADDRVRLDDFFTSIRQLETQLDLQLQKPPPAEACAIPSKVAEPTISPLVADVQATNKIMCRLVAMAVACNQTKVFNIVFGGDMRAPGVTNGNHQITHEERVDEQLGYQKQAAWFVERHLEGFADFLEVFTSVKEGAGCLLDNCLVLANTEVALAKVHGMTSLPMMIAGKAGGRTKTGLHIKGNGDTTARVGLTLQQVMGLPVDKWGTSSNATSKTITELLAKV